MAPLNVSAVCGPDSQAVLTEATLSRIFNVETEGVKNEDSRSKVGE
jgi:hypothetical protein